MADANYYSKYQQQNQVHNYNNPSKFYSHFLYKALIATIFLVILPLFPSQAPGFINQTLNTRGWEFLQLIFVGIAVSYGLFSRRNDETEKDSINSSSSSNHSKFYNAQSYISRFLQVSSVFDDEGDIPSLSYGSTVQTWNNQYYRNEPVVIVADEHSVLDLEQRGASSRIGEKPLLLPVRSLKSRLLDADANRAGKESLSGSASISRSNSNLGSKRIPSNLVRSRNGELLSGLHNHDLEDNLKDNVGLPSPIPWRSRSGRMEMKEPKEETDSPPLCTLPPFSMEESEFNRSFRAQVSRAPTSSPKLSPSSSMSSPKKFSTSPSFSAETQGKIAEDFVRKKSVFRSPPPPPPPPPPPEPQLLRRTWTMKPSSGSNDDEVFIEKDLKRTFTSGPKDMNWVGSFSMVKSVGTTRKEKEFDDVLNKKISKEVEASTMERRGRKTVGFDQSPSFKTEKINRERVTFKPQPTFMEFPKEGKEEFVEKFVLESDEDLEDEEEDEISTSSFVSGNSKNEEGSFSIASDGGPDVDKKADEFIAKFREQIRLQRIESIKRSSGQINRKSTR